MEGVTNRKAEDRPAVNKDQKSTSADPVSVEAVGRWRGNLRREEVDDGRGRAGGVWRETSDTGGPRRARWHRERGGRSGVGSGSSYKSDSVPLILPPQERGKSRDGPNVEGARRVDGRRVPKDATHSIGNDVISGGAVNDVDGVGL